MKDYIQCPKRKGNPKISKEVCINTCKYFKKCKAFYNYRHPALFPGLENAVTRVRNT